jgi:hypothetical protein
LLASGTKRYREKERGSMVTKRELQEDDVRRAWLAEEAARRSEEWRKGQGDRDLKRAKGLLDDELGRALKRLNAAGQKMVKLSQSGVWTADGGEIYDEKFMLGFEPRPSYEPTLVLIRHLQEAGFVAFVEADEERDDYGPGTHLLHFLVIDWR